jgi:hypothetical protein
MFMRRSPKGSGLLEWSMAFPVFLMLSLSTLQVLVVAFHGTYLDFSAREIARRVSVQGLGLSDQERIASEALSWMWPRDWVHPSPAYLQARATRLVSVSRLSPTETDFRAWTDPRDGRFLPLSPGEMDARGHQAGARSLSEASTVVIELVSLQELSIPLVGRLLGETIAWSRGCSGLMAIGEDCLFLTGRHPMHPGKSMLPLRRQGRSLLQPAISNAQSNQQD